MVSPKYVGALVHLDSGTNFKMYTDREKQAITHQLIKGGDAKYHNIAAASILAKCYHDDYVDELLNNDPELEKYGWRTNMCYGTKAHMEAIKNYGITKHHRKLVSTNNI